MWQCVAGDGDLREMRKLVDEDGVAKWVRVPKLFDKAIWARAKAVK